MCLYRLIVSIVFVLFPSLTHADKVNFIVIEDDLTSVNVDVDLLEEGEYSFPLLGNKVLNVVVTPGEDTTVASELIDLKSGDVLNASRQGKRYSFSGPNLYLLCNGKLIKRLAPAKEIEHKCSF